MQHFDRELHLTCQMSLAIPLWHSSLKNSNIAYKSKNFIKPGNLQIKMLNKKEFGKIRKEIADLISFLCRA